VQSLLRRRQRRCNLKHKKQMSRQAAAGICATTPIAGAKTIEEPDALKGKSHA
jgi:hypothetical protein